MAILKCKMCGGDLNIIEGATVVECEYCGTKQTVSKSRDEIVSNLFNRANNLRLKCEFDKAEQVYEKILDIDNTDAEAHWGIVLCKYGIEYVEDHKTYSRIPTCHRTLYEAVLTDVDYLATIKNADDEQKNLYIEEAKSIDKLQKNILDIVNHEEPFDVFICYKETDANGKRTVDSTIANDIYYQLTQEGFKVFYAAITLEDKLGHEYEPYIFAALNSSKVMLVLGTKPEYFSAVWVKNEWSRFMQLMRTDRSKLLIPCYRDIDAYELPEEFAHLQAQDMSKIGFINDVVRGIKKVATSTEPTKTVVKETVVAGGNANTASLLKRAFMFLEDGDFNSANEYCEKVLDIDPECAEAYFGKLMADLKLKNKDDFSLLKESFENNSNYQKAIRFASAELKEFLEICNIEAFYKHAKGIMHFAQNEEDFKNAQNMFKKLTGYKDSNVLAIKCAEKACQASEKEMAMQKKEKAIIISLSSAMALIIIILTAIGIYDNVIVPKKFLQEFKQANVGDTVKFGVYEQDNNSTNGKEFIEWIVLDRQGDKALLISKYVLDCEVFGETTWDNSTIRTWLNDTFLNDAFGGRSDKSILITKVEAHKNPYAEWITGSSTKDKIFLLSIDEAKEYFANDELRISGITEYSKAKGVFGSKENGGAWWWLRTSSKHAEFVAYVSYDGSICNGGCDGLSDDVGIRPAMWIDLSKVK